MALHKSRRAVLQAVGASSVAGFAGCLRVGGPETETRPSTEEEAPGSSTDQSPTSTTAVSGRSYRIVAKNGITRDDLRDGDGWALDTPTVLHLKAYRNPESGADEVFFEKTVELAPGETRTFPDAFTTEADGTEYVVLAELENFEDAAGRQDRSKYYRFVPGGFQWPSSDTFRAAVMDVDRVEGTGIDPVVPVLSLGPL